MSLNARDALSNPSPPLEDETSVPIPERAKRSNRRTPLVVANVGVHIELAERNAQTEASASANLMGHVYKVEPGSGDNIEDYPIINGQPNPRSGLRLHDEGKKLKEKMGVPKDEQTSQGQRSGT